MSSQQVADASLPTSQFRIANSSSSSMESKKLGSTQGEFDRAKRSWVQREQALQDQGWRFLRVNWQDFNDWSELRRRINSAIGVVPQPIPASYALLWEPPSERCDSEGRRFRRHQWHGTDGSWT